MTVDYIHDYERLFLLDDEMMQQRYTIYRHVQDGQRIFWSERVQRWFCTRYTDVREALRNPQLSSENLPAVLGKLPAEIRQALDQENPLLKQARTIMIARDDPDHARLRSLVNKAFTPRMIERQRPQITRLAHDLLDKMEQQEQPDFVRDFAAPLPIMVIAAMIGILYDDLEQIKQWSDIGADFLGRTADLNILLQMAVAANEFNAYLHPHIEKRRQQPEEDLLSAFILAEAQGDKLTEDETIANVFLLLAAGNETTTNLLGNGLWTLLKHPDQLARLQKHPEMIETAVEEIVRFESPAQLTGRIAKTAVEVAGQRIEAGQNVTLILGAANRDPAQFADPDSLDVGRQDNRHIGFGLGAHYCLGAPLARLEAQVTLPILLARYPRIQLVNEQARWRKNPLFLGLESLPITLA